MDERLLYWSFSVLLAAVGIIVSGRYILTLKVERRVAERPPVDLALLRLLNAHIERERYRVIKQGLLGLAALVPLVDLGLWGPLPETGVFRQVSILVVQGMFLWTSYRDGVNRRAVQQALPPVVKEWRGDDAKRPARL